MLVYDWWEMVPGESVSKQHEDVLKMPFVYVKYSISLTGQTTIHYLLKCCLSLCDVTVRKKSSTWWHQKAIKTK